jgi:peptidoglycan/xylan/chitin deacetylase (PgdA/CDA1 family)
MPPAGPLIALAAALIVAGLAGAAPAEAQSVPAATTDWITGAPRQPMPVVAWPGSRKVAVCFVLYVEVWGKGHGPNFRPDMKDRNPDIVDEAFRQYAIEWGVPRAGRLFKEMGVPLSIALNAQFPEQHPDIWKQFRASVPEAPILGHGFNNSTQMLPLGKGVDAQAAYIRRTLDMIAKDTGVRPRGWSSPSVFNDADTYAATAAAGLGYSLDAMDSDVLTRLVTPSGPLVMIPYPSQTVDMGQYLLRNKEAGDLERLWIDYVTELAHEAALDPSRPATVVAIGIHPFVIGTPAGAASFRRVLEALKKQPLVWLTDTDTVMAAAGQKP